MSITILIIALLVGAVGFIVTAARRLQGQSVSGQMFRRGFQYVLLYALILIVANGVADLLSRLFGDQTAVDDEFLLAQSLTAIVIALPIAAILTWWIWRTHRKNSDERDSLLYQAYLTAAALTGAAMMAANFQQTLTTATGSATLNTDALAGLVIWTLVWVIHWRIIGRTLTQANTVAHVLLGSAIGLVLVASGLIELVATSIELLTGPQVIIGPYVDLGSAAGMFISGAVVWIVYWFTSATKMPRGTSWHAYVLLFGVAGGLITALFGAQALLWHGLVQLIGQPALFARWLEWPDAVGALVIGATVWWYHRVFLDRTHYTPVRRVYKYLVAGIGAVAAAAGIGLLVLSLIDATAPATLFHHPINTLLGALTLLTIGAVVWWYHWQIIQRATQDNPATELTAVPRRIYLVLLLGGPAVVIVISLISAVVDLFHDVMQGQLSVATLYKVRTELGFLTAGLALIAYHAAILRQDQQQAPAQPELPVRDGTLTLIGPAGPHLETALAKHFEGPVRLLAIEVTTSWDTDAILAALDTYDPGDDVVIIAREDGIEVHPAADLRYLQ